MRLTIPLTGTVLVEGSVYGAGDLTGDPNDPIRPVGLNLGNVSWVMVDVDLEKEVMVIEVEPGEYVSESESKSRKATAEEKAASLRAAQAIVMGHTKEELYAMSGSSRLKRPFGLVKSPGPGPGPD